MNEVMTPERALELLQAADDTSTKAVALVPATPTQDALAVYASNEAERQKLVCVNLLTPKEQQAALDNAKIVLPELISNVNVLMTFGTDSVDALNALVKKALDEDKTEVAEIDALMREMQDNLSGVQRKYDVSRPEVRKKFEKGKNRFLGFLWQAKSMLQMLIQDSQTAARQMEGIGKRVESKADAAMEDANLFKQLYDANEVGIRTLVFKIAVLEYVRSMVLGEFDSIKVDENDPAQRDLIERRNVLGKVLNSLNIRIGDFQARLMDAYATSPEFSDWVQANFDLALKLDFLYRVGIPAINKTLLTWQKNAAAVGSAKMITGINDFYNDVTQRSAQAGAEGVKEVEMAAQQPVMYAETLGVILKAAQDRAQGIRDAAKAGTDARMKFAEGALSTIQGLQVTQAQLQQDLADQAASEALALKAAMEAHKVVDLMPSESTQT